MWSDSDQFVVRWGSNSVQDNKNKDTELERWLFQLTSLPWYFQTKLITLPLLPVLCSYIVPSLLYFVNLCPLILTWVYNVIYFIMNVSHSFWCDILSPSFCPRSMTFWFPDCSISLVQSNQQIYRKIKVTCNIEQKCWSGENGRIGWYLDFLLILKVGIEVLREPEALWPGRHPEPLFHYKETYYTISSLRSGIFVSFVHWCIQVPTIVPGI